MTEKRFTSRVVMAGGLAAAVAVGTVAYAGNNTPPPAEQVTAAQGTGDLLFNELLAALLQEFNETTPDNAEQGKQAISLIFHNDNRDIRLIGREAPLAGGYNDLPSDDFEAAALEKALHGNLGAGGEAHTGVDKVNGRWYWRRSVPLSNFHDNCVACHANFGPKNVNQWVGALLLRVPIGAQQD